MEVAMKRLHGFLLVVLAMSMTASGAWVNVTSNLAGKSCACGNVYCLWAPPGQNKVITGICGNIGLFATTDNGTSWQPMGTSTAWVDPQTILFDKDNPDIFWETGIHAGALHKTTDGGQTFSILPGVSGGDALSVDMSDPQRKTIVYGAHEASNIMKSIDGGATWTNITNGISTRTSFPVVIDAQTFIIGSENGGGIYRSTNGGNSWTKVSTYSPKFAGLLASDGSVYFTEGGNQAILKSADNGATWTRMAKPGQGDGMNTPVEMPDHSIVAIGSTGLVRCSNGSTWTTITTGLPSAGGMVWGNLCYNSISQSFFLAFWDCASTIPSNALWKYDYATSVIKEVKKTGSISAVPGNNRIVIAGSYLSTGTSRITKSYDLFGRKLQHMKQAGIGAVIIQVKK
jgi:photosystem II stability/assembly factor-like uncharacterized protein